MKRVVDDSGYVYLNMVQHLGTNPLPESNPSKRDGETQITEIALQTLQPSELLPLETAPPKEKERLKKSEIELSILHEAIERVKTNVPSHLVQHITATLDRLVSKSDDLGEMDAFLVGSCLNVEGAAFVDFVTYEYLKQAIKSALFPEDRERYANSLKEGPRSILKGVAQETKEILQEQYIGNEDLERMQEGTCLLSVDDLEKQFHSIQDWKSYETKVVVYQMNGVELARILKQKGDINPPVMMMTNHSHPGGFWEKKGSFSQEGDLFYRTTCSQAFIDNPFLLKQMGSSYYLPETSVIYVPYVEVIRHSVENYYHLFPVDQTFFVDLIAVAAYHLGSSDSFVPQPDSSEYKEGTKQKIRAVLYAALVNKHVDIVLGALGCGGFKNDPTNIANLFAEVLQERAFHGKFRLIAFAILGENFSHFQRILRTSLPQDMVGENALEDSSVNSSQIQSLRTVVQKCLHSETRPLVIYDQKIIQNALATLGIFGERALEMERKITEISTEYLVQYDDYSKDSDGGSLFFHSQRVRGLLETYFENTYFVAADVDDAYCDLKYTWYPVVKFLEFAFEVAHGIKDPELYSKELKEGKKYALKNIAIETEKMLREKDLLIDQDRLIAMQQGTEIFSELKIQEAGPLPTSPGFKATIVVSREDSLEAALGLIRQGYRPVVLNMANSRSPGGGYRHGAGAQEETLIYRTSYMFGLNPYFNQALKEKLPQGVYLIPEMGGIYTPHVQILRESANEFYERVKERQFVDMIAAAAYNRNPKSKNPSKLSDSEYASRTKRKIQNVLKIALLKQHDAIVLGAWGCGGFCNSPELMARFFREVIQEDEFKGRFKAIVFAVLGENNKIFENVLGGLEI